MAVLAVAVPAHRPAHRSHRSAARGAQARSFRLALAALALWAGLATPALAKLQDPVTEFKHSRLIKGDTLFKFDGRIGARFRFSGATHCIFGDALLSLDTVDGTIVQESIVMALPNDARDRRMTELILNMFVDDLELKKEDADVVRAAFEDGLQNGKTLKTTLGGFLGRKYELDVIVNPGLRSLLLMVGVA